MSMLNQIQGMYKNIDYYECILELRNSLLNEYTYAIFYKVYNTSVSIEIEHKVSR